jgi:hypothetical protein
MTLSPILPILGQLGSSSSKSPTLAVGLSEEMVKRFEAREVPCDSSRVYDDHPAAAKKWPMRWNDRAAKKTTQHGGNSPSPSGSRRSPATRCPPAGP